MFRFPMELVTIDGFRGLRKLCLEQLGQINILVGPNNSGKTSVLEALSIFCHADDPLEWLWMAQRRESGGLVEARIQSLRWCFTQNGQLAEPGAGFEGECTFFCGGANSLRSLRANYREIQEEPIRGADKNLDGGSVPEQQRFVHGSYLDVEPRRGAEITHRIEFGDPGLLGPRTVEEPIAIRVWDDDPVLAQGPPPRRGLMRVDTLTPASYQISGVHSRYHAFDEFGADGEMVLDLIRQFDPEITDIRKVSVHGMRPTIYLDHERLGVAPLSVFGDALRRAVVLAGTMLALKDRGILLIDEVETGIHISVLERVLRWIARVARQLNVQVVATTQSLEAVDAMAAATADGKRGLVTFHLDQTAEGTMVKRIDADLLLRLRRERALDVR